MTNLETISESFQGLLAQACLSALLAIVGVAAAAKILKKIRVAFSSLWRKSRFSFAAVMLLSLAMFLWADKTNLLRMIIHPGGTPVVVGSEDILRGFHLEGIVTNDEPLCDMPVDAVEYAPWRLRGGRETDFPLNLGAFVFPYGTNAINRFRILSGGTIETYPKLNAPVSICAAREYSSLIPDVSRFWSADANGGAEKVLRWDSVFANDDRTGGYSAEIRLFANGDFSTRSNALETVYRRVNPHDWDGDGLANEIDANPYESDGDFFGTGVDWLNVNCAGVLSAVTNGMGEVEISWHTNANPNAYYWLDLTATGALGIAKITATCDGESNLGDLAIIARTNEVCRVPLLVGATYTVESDLPISYSAVSSEHASIFTNSEHSLVVSYPVSFAFEEVNFRNNPPGAPRTYRLTTTPEELCASVLALSGGCCPASTNEFGVSMVCGDGCLCVGCAHDMDVTALWEGYRGHGVADIHCSCANERQDENGAFLAMRFSSGVVVFEDSYANDPGVYQPRRSTDVFLAGRVVGGRHGGRLTYSLVNRDKLMLMQGGVFPSVEPMDVLPGEVEEVVARFEGLAASDGTNDIVAGVAFVENTTGRIFASTSAVTCVRVELRPQDYINDSVRQRHRVGIGEWVEYMAYPQSIEYNAVATKGGSLMTTNSSAFFISPYNAETNGLRFDFPNGLQYVPELEVVEPTGVVVTRATDVRYVNAMPNMAGWCGLFLDLNVMPTNVSFRALSVMEVPETEDNGIAPTGYFASAFFSNSWHHTTYCGAGQWKEVVTGNFFLEDAASFMLGLEGPWSPGTITWHIPVAWKPKKDSNWTLGPVEFGQPYFQKFTIDSAGTIRVEKLNHWAERSPDGSMRRSENTSIGPLVEIIK